MRKILQYIFVSALLTVPAVAQSRPSRVFDNFDMAKGVKVVLPVVAAPPVVEAKKNKSLVKKTAQVTAVKTPPLRTAAAAAIGRVTMAMERSMGNFTTGDGKVDSYILDSAKRYNIDPLLIYAQMHQESSFKPKATSNKGASGLMQLMPATARRMGVTDIYNPKQNIEGGIKYMRLLLDMFGGDVALALAGYNAGEGAVMKYGNQIPPYRETQEYVRRIGARYNQITNPNLAKIVRKVSDKQAVKLEQKEAAPLTTLERSALAIRTADGRMRLVNQ